MDCRTITHIHSYHLKHSFLINILFDDKLKHTMPTVASSRMREHLAENCLKMKCEAATPIHLTRPFHLNRQRINLLWQRVQILLDLFNDSFFLGVGRAHALIAGRARMNQFPSLHQRHLEVPCLSRILLANDLHHSSPEVVFQSYGECIDVAPVPCSHVTNQTATRL